jgi:hypothetical protein
MDELNYNEMAMRIFLERIHELEETINIFQSNISEKNYYIRNLEESLKVTKEQLNSLKEEYAKES